MRSPCDPHMTAPHGAAGEVGPPEEQPGPLSEPVPVMVPRHLGLFALPELELGSLWGAGTRAPWWGEPVAEPQPIASAAAAHRMADKDGQHEVQP